LAAFAKCPQYRLVLPRPRTYPRGYPLELAKIGDHIRKRRLDLGLLQIEVAATIGVSENTVWNWEHGTEPELIHIPKIIEFLGYVPFDCPEDPIGKLKYFKQVKGLSYEKLGDVMGRDPEQLNDWVSGRHKPCCKNIQRIKGFLEQEPKQ
jgi:transcriptional regulator with XRE-family HTH domain